MDVIDERVFLEEVARRVNEFFRDFPIEAHRIFGEPTVFGHEVAEMFQVLLGENTEVPFAVMFMAILAGPTGNPGYHLAMDEDETGMLCGFHVVEASPTPEETVEEATKPKPNLN